MGDYFSRRHGYRARREITIREDAPVELRAALIATMHDLGLTYSRMRTIVCSVLRAIPNANNWTEVPNVRDEVSALIDGCEWFRVYDICEAVYRHLADPGFAGYGYDHPNGAGDEFSQRLNELFEEFGIGWQMIEGQIVTRGPEDFERVVNEAVARVQEAGQQTPKQELEEARRDLSRRPDPDITGTVQHCMAALECTARSVSGDQRATLGEVIERHGARIGIPAPLDNGIERMWGYASEMARHLREGRLPSREEAELLLNISAALTLYLVQKNRLHGDDAG
jgi:AbiJ N-terminal domain 4